MTARLTPQREAEIVEWRDLLGTSHCAEDAGPYSALRDLLAEVEAQRAESAAVRAERDELKRTSERDLDQVMRERDEYHEVADKLAYAVAPEEVIGEHSSMNDPWENAYELITPKAEVDKLRTQLAKQRDEIADDIHRAELPIFAETENPVLVAKTVRAIDVRIADMGREAPYWVARAGERS